MKFIFTLLVICFCSNSFAQKVDSLKEANINYLKKQLAVSDGKAQDVLTIQENYKASAKKILNDANISADDKKSKFQALIDDKNQRLRAILTVDQLRAIVPTTELVKK